MVVVHTHSPIYARASMHTCTSTCTSPHTSICTHTHKHTLTCTHSSPAHMYTHHTTILSLSLSHTHTHFTCTQSSPAHMYTHHTTKHTHSLTHTYTHTLTTAAGTPAQQEWPEAQREHQAGGARVCGADLHLRPGPVGIQQGARWRCHFPRWRRTCPDLPQELLQPVERPHLVIQVNPQVNTKGQGTVQQSKTLAWIHTLWHRLNHNWTSRDKSIV